jgi:hypothetical protein
MAANLFLTRLVRTILNAGVPLAGVCPDVPEHATGPASYFLTSQSRNFRIDAPAGSPHTGPQQTTVQGILDAFDWTAPAQASWTATQAIADGKSIYDALGALDRTLRAIVKLTVDQFNNRRVGQVGSAQAVWDPTNLADGVGVTSPALTVTGAVFGDGVIVAPPYSLQGIVMTGFVVVRLQNETGGTINLVSGTWGVIVVRQLPMISYADARTAIFNNLDGGA